MCGIAAILDPRRRTSAETARDHVQRMTDALAHRGPDHSAVWLDANAGIALGHTRLAVIDLSAAGNQPMLSGDRRLTIVYNGELYNTPELRTELERQGHAFRGHSDTEVLLAGCATWGVQRCLMRADGMFAFALWDARDRSLTLARDRLGEKPLYWGRVGDLWLFASELKALRVHPAWQGELDPAALEAYLRYRFVPAPMTIYRGIQKLPPAHILEVRGGGEPRLTRYWDAAAVAADGPVAIDDKTAIDELDMLLGDAVGRRMIADVPLGSFLSGGIDSSLVTALMQARGMGRVRTFSIGFRARGFDEAPFARAVATHLGTDHTELYAEPADAIALIPQLATIYDEPFADASQIPTCLLAGLTRQHVTVALAGDGGDELFAGYRRYQETDQAWRRLSRLPRSCRRLAGYGFGAFGKALRSTSLGRSLAITPLCPSPERLEYWASIAGLADADAFYHQRGLQWRDATKEGRPPANGSGGNGRAAPPVGDFFARMQLADLMSYLPDDILTKVDRATMAVALECRAPLLDREVVEFALRLPRHLKVRDGIGKWALRRVLARYLPEPLFDRPKVGFSVPLGNWLRGPLRPWAEGLLDRRRLDEEGLLDPGAVTERWQQHVAGRRDWSAHLWTILMLQAWRESTTSAVLGSSGEKRCVSVYANGQSASPIYGNATNIVS